MDSSPEQAKRPVSVLAGPYGHPFHPILVTVPIGAWVASLVFDVASEVVSGPGFLAKGSLWLIAVGVISALAAAAIGFLDLIAIPPGSKAQQTALIHMMLNVIVVGAYVANFAWRRGSYAHPGAVGLPMITLSAASLAVLAVSGYLGGMLAFKYGVRVADEHTQAEAYADSGAPSP
jgi:uncharacterized membrane protein